MFKVKIKYEILAELLDVASSVVDDARFNFTKDGPHVDIADQSHISVAYLRYGKAAYEAFDGNEGVILLNLAKLKEFLNIGEKGQVIDITYKDKFVVQIGDTKRVLSPLSETDVEEVKVVEIQPKATMQIKLDMFKKAAKSGSSITDQFVVTFKPDGVLMNSTSGDNLDTVETFYPKDKLLKYEEIPNETKYSSIYPLKHLNSLLSSIHFADQLTIGIGDQFPMKIKFVLGGGTGECIYLLAPRAIE